MVIDSKTSGIIVTVVLVIMACRVIYLNVKLAKLESCDLHVRLTEAICAANMELLQQFITSETSYSKKHGTYQRQAA